MKRAVVFAIIVVSLVISKPAVADHGANYVSPPWATTASTNYRVPFYFTPTITNPNVGDLIIKAAGEWNSAGQHFNFVQGARIGNYDFTKPCYWPPARNGIFIWPYDMTIRSNAGLLGKTYPCPARDGNMYAANVTFNSNAHWYVGYDDAPAADEDFWSIATHELGHMAGEQHLTEDPNHASYCDNNSSHQTMCPDYWQGTERDRTPDAAHDLTAFDARY